MTINHIIYTKVDEPRPNKRPKQRKLSRKSKVEGIGIVVLALIILAGLGWAYFARQFSKPQGNSNTVKYIKIEEGENRESIAKRLGNEGIIGNPDLFIWYMRISGEGGNIKAGGHEIRSDYSIKEIVEALESSPIEDSVNVTVVEGLRYDEIANVLDNALSLLEEKSFNKEEFLTIVENPHTAGLDENVSKFLNKYLPQGKNLEGYLYPDTYSFNSRSTAPHVVNTMISNLITRLGDDTFNKLSLKQMSLYDLITVASMIEREAYTEEQARMIAGIINNRREQNYPLGIDATSLYELKDWDATLTQQVLDNPTPYNTRTKVGLPPTPICNPGILSISAALDPQANDYLYYLHDSNMNIHYARTNAEHEANKSKYIY